ncbi:MAG TPA: hypothetical protein VLX68_04640 [Chitinivibrionales bacterium]|nr:hypothetical protein [Chitinivibrionales bacterium]
MLKKIAVCLCIAFALAVPSFADTNGKVTLVMNCSDTRFEFTINTTGGSNRFIVLQDAQHFGVDQFNRIYAMVLTAYATGATNCWVGAPAFVPNTGNCAALNTPGAVIYGFAIQ